MANEIILYDYEISDDCCNEDSFGYVCLKCGQCGRKFANGMLQKEGADNESERLPEPVEETR